MIDLQLHRTPHLEVSYVRNVCIATFITTSDIEYYVVVVSS